MYSNAINKHISDRLSLKNAKWNWAMLSINKNITWEIVKENINRPWDWFRLSRNKNITWEFVKGNMDKPWDWHGLSRNENITWEIVKENTTLPWNWYELSCNEHSTWEIVKENMDSPWDWSELSKNRDMLLSLDDKKNIVLEHHSASVIQRVWRIVVSNPNYLVCKKRLLYEYTCLENI